MNCLRSFILSVGGNSTVSGGNLAQWGLAPQNYYIATIDGLSTFNIEGFKNVNIHAVEMLGDVSSVVGGTDQVIVNDWSFQLEILGQNPFLNGGITVTPNTFIMQRQAINPVFTLSRYNTKLTLVDPIVSASTIRIAQLKASGIGARNITAANLQWRMTLIVYYNYEGE
jgi:hypothetical protein